MLPDLLYLFGVLGFNERTKSNPPGYENKIMVYKLQQEERQRISADMHDELGSGITAIRLMSETAKKKVGENFPPELDRISVIAADMINNMNAIIWSMDEKEDSLENMVNYIINWSQEFFENTRIDCRVKPPPKIKSIIVNGEARRNIFLTVKETLNNIMKHADATSVLIEIKTEPVFKIHISDNGRGIDEENLRPFGNGLKNIRRRMQSVGGTFSIQNKDGTLVELMVPL